MALLERGKGSRKRTVEIRLQGTLLTRDEVDGPSVMLRGYRRLGSEEAARAALAQEVAKLLGEGLKAADEEASEIVAGLPTRPRGKPTLPLRQDAYVYNEATGFMITSLKMAGKTLEEGSRGWDGAVAKGEMIPVALFQDDPFVARVVVGDDLEPGEAEEWVSRVDWHLAVKDGKLCVTGGAPLVSEDYEPEDSYYDQFVRTIEIPKGHYRAAIYAYVPGGINGKPVLDHVAGGYDASEPMGAWFRRTRPDEPFPAWLRSWCASAPEDDPGHESEWKGVALREDEDPDYVGFLVHLTPTEEPPTEGLSEPENGWFGEAWNARKPDRAPLGLEARDPIGRFEELGDTWLFAHDVIRLSEDLEPEAVAGGPVPVPLGDVPAVLRLAWFCSRLAIPVLRVALPEGVDLDVSGDWPEGVVAAPIDGSVRLIFSNDLHPVDVFPVLAALAGRLRALPDGALLELYTTVPQAYDGTDPDAGRHAYLGEVRGGEWRIAKAYPAVGATTLTRALALSREIENGRSLACADADEAHAILKWAEGNFGLHLEDNPASIVGSEIRLQEEDPAVLALYRVAAFAKRFGDAWPVTDLSDDDEEQVEDAAPEGDPWDLDAPVVGAEILVAKSGRVYNLSMALLWKASLAEQIKAEEPAFGASGYRHVADLICDQFPSVVVRGYARSEGMTWVSFLVAAPGTLVLELTSRFGDGASLLSGRNPTQTDDLARASYRQGFADAGFEQLLAHHEARLAELEGTHGPPLRTVPSAKGLAQWIETTLVKQLGE